MLRFLADENLSGAILRGLQRRFPELGIVRAQDEEISGAEDPRVLAWAAAEGRILVTHDARTMPGHAYDRVRAGEPMPGVLIYSAWVQPGLAIGELAMIASCSEAEEWKDKVTRLPL
ncbi:DUF5615 family PIN-like protein [Planctomycetota bacterium]